MGIITIESLRKKRRERTQSDARALQEKATIVAVAQTHATKGSVTTFRVVDVDGTYIPNMVWVRFYGGADNEVYEALNINGVKARANLPVVVEQYEPGKYEVTKLRAKEANELLGSAAPHFSGTDDIPELTDPIAAAHTGAGRVRLASESDQLTVFVEPFWYSWNGIRVRWPGGSLDISGELPATSSYWGWCQIAINPATNTAAAISGSEVSSYPQLTDDSLDDIDVSGYIPVDAVKLQNGMTSSNGLNRPEYFFAGRITLVGVTGVIATSPATLSGTALIPSDQRALWDGPVVVSGTLTVSGSLRVLAS